jgi:hypothetical protein
MTIAVWPASPLPAGTDRTPFWQMDENFYDSGAHQAMTPYARPLYRYAIPYRNFTESKRAVLLSFWNQQRRQGNAPFLIKDPYDYAVASVEAVPFGFATGSGSVRLYDTSSFFIRVDTTTVASLFSALSGYVRNGVEYSYNIETGLLTVNVKNVNDTWGARSLEYFRKVVFAPGYQYREQGVIWNVFEANVELQEVV